MVSESANRKGDMVSVKCCVSKIGQVQRRTDRNVRQGKVVGIRGEILLGETQAEIQDRKGWGQVVKDQTDKTKLVICIDG